MLLQRTPHFLSLIWTRKNIGDRGAECLANALVLNSTLRVLFLDDNDIINRGAECVANAFATNSTLLDLDYLHNNISDRRTELRRIASHLKRKKNANKDKSALVVMSQHQNHGKQEAEDAVLVGFVEDGAEGSVCPYAILNEEEEDALSYHTAAKYGGMEHLMIFF